MLNYKYISNPKVGDLVGYVIRGYNILPSVVVGFGKQGNMQVVLLAKRQVEMFKTPKDQRPRYYGNPVKSVAKNHLMRVVPIDATTLSQEEHACYNYLVNNGPQP